MAAMLLGYIDSNLASVAWKQSGATPRSHDILVHALRERPLPEDLAEAKAYGAMLDFNAAIELLQLQD